MRTLEMLLDMAALVGAAGTPGRTHIDIFGDDAVAAALPWAASRGIEVGSPSELHSDDRGRCFSYSIPLASNYHVHVYTDWRPVVDSTAAIDATPAGGAA